MKNIFLLLILFTISSCGNKEEQIKEKVKVSVMEELSKKNILLYDLETEIVNLELINKKDNEYVGILTTHEYHKKGSKKYSKTDTLFNSFISEYDISVISDGDKVLYELSNKRLKR